MNLIQEAKQLGSNFISEPVANASVENVERAGELLSELADDARDVAENALCAANGTMKILADYHSTYQSGTAPAWIDEKLLQLAEIVVDRIDSISALVVPL